MATGGVGDALGVVAEQAKELADDPLLFLVKFLRALGVALLAAGGVLALLGYYLKAEAVRAHQEVGQLWGQVVNAWGKIGAEFANLQPLPNPLQNSSLPILTKNPLTDLANLGSDVANGLSGVVGDISKGIQDLATGLEDIPPALVALGQALGSTVLAVPSLLGGELTYFVGGAAGGWMLNIFPYILIGGAACLIASFAVGFARSGYREAVKPAWDRSRSKWAARQSRKLEQRFDAFWHNPPETPAPPSIEAAPAAEAQRTQPEGGGGEVVPPVSSSEGPATPEPPASPSHEPEAHPDAPAPLPMGTPTSEVERQLGEGDVLEPTAEEVAAMEVAREESLPDETPPDDLETERRIELLEEGLA